MEQGRGVWGAAAPSLLITLIASHDLAGGDPPGHVGPGSHPGYGGEALVAEPPLEHMGLLGTTLHPALALLLLHSVIRFDLIK